MYLVDAPKDAQFNHVIVMEECSIGSIPLSGVVWCGIETRMVHHSYNILSAVVLFP